MSPAGDIWPTCGVPVSWYFVGSQFALAAMAAFPITAASPVPRVTASSANQAEKTFPPPVAVSWANFASRLKRNAVSGESVGWVSGFAAGFASGFGAIWPHAGEAQSKARVNRRAAMLKDNLMCGFSSGIDDSDGSRSQEAAFKERTAGSADGELNPAPLRQKWPHLQTVY